MSLLNPKCIGALLLLGIATWNFPWGIALDAGIVAVWFLIKRKRVPAATKGAKVAPGQASIGGGGDEMARLLAMAMLSDKITATGDAAAASLGLPPSTARKPPARKAAAPKMATDFATKQRFLD
jgi:hypothetical protein